MPEVLDLTFFAFAIPAVIFAGVSKGGFGSGAAFAATPLLALILEPGAAIGLMLPLLMLMDVTALRPYWKQWHGPSAWALILGAVPGVVAGLTSFISHAGGPPAAVFLLSRGLDKTTYQATTVIVFWAINLMKFIPYAFLGIFSWQTAKADLFLIPFAILGVWLGVWAHRVFSERAYFTLTYALLVVTGGKLVWDALV